jgi:para-aminobenzoate synthetase / 4-amino-4-deoxychorismate lyase
VIDARFDDLGRASARSFRLVNPVGTIEARRTEEVAGALAAVDAATERGLWAGGFLSYEAAPGLDPALSVRARDPADPFSDLPLLWFALFEDVADVELPDPTAEEPGAPLDAWVPSIARGQFDAAIAEIRERIAAGDTYQVNYTLRLRAGIEGDERGLYRDLCLAQRGSYASYLNLGRYRVLSASPELFFCIDADRITTRPMKGTLLRGRWPAEDDDAARRLVASTKDRAENAMIVDLLRNDLGRISRPGSVDVPSMFDAERYETVWQLTSTVTSRLVPDVALADVFRALFPSGSVTGAPKIRSMGIIADLEDSPRGAYTGAVGYVAPRDASGPRANFNVAIRTVMLDTSTGLAEYGVGGGITHDSSAAAEYDEVLAKARVLTVRRPPFSLFETVRHDPHDGFHQLDPHLRRLASSARYFGFACDERAVAEALEKAVAGEDVPVRVRCVLARDGELDVTVGSLSERDPNVPVRLAIDDRRVDPNDALLFHKTTLRGRYERAVARHPGADDVLLVNVRREVTESTVANVAAQIDGRWWTPPLDAGLLPGIGRAAALAEGALRERPITLEEIGAAQEIALVSSVRGWRRAVLVEGADRA